MSAYWAVHLSPHFRGYQKFKTLEECFSYCETWAKDHPDERLYPHSLEGGFWSGNFKIVGGAANQDVPRYVQLLMEYRIRCNACTGPLYGSDFCWADDSQEGFECKCVFQITSKNMMLICDSVRLGQRTFATSQLANSGAFCIFTMCIYDNMKSFVLLCIEQ